ncbi:SusC/RagA family TonB-linked outer membrane protein [Flavicella marina]|uniref:SusC/RagA family TonB-linked outer membrane protein n=1 Tax=Flavicella marina TaxID=1475951 RepID=UPI0012655EB4|nr:TonB-dependent receptor [Flavicella marina]
MKKIRKLEPVTTCLNLDGIVTSRFFKKALFSAFCVSLGLNEVNANEFTAIKSSDLNLTSEEVVFAPVQQIEITGTVSDDQGPMPGVNVMIKGTSKGTQTDFDGNFKINVDSRDAVLVFSYIGFSDQQISVGTNTNLNVTMKADVEGLDEVVVLGYTTRKKGDVTGSVSTVGSETLQQTTNKDLAKSLSGKVTGVIISDRGGVPGSTDEDDLSILIRGKATPGNNQPLILIDGVPSGSFSQLSAQDIASLTVLKDGAAAIYGARAANGVILITTKRGGIGKPTVNLSTSYGISQFSAFPNQMTSEQYAIYENEIAERNGLTQPFSDEDIAKYAAGNDPLNYPSTQWGDLTFKSSAPESRTSISVSGGTERVKYFVSGDFIKQEGMFRTGSLNFKQNQVRSNIDINLTKDFKVGVDLSGRFGDRNAPGVSQSYIYKHVYTNFPTEVGVYPNGLPAWGGENGSNPYIMATDASGNVNRKDNDLRSRFSFDWNLNKLTDGLSVKGWAGIRKQSYDEKNWYTPWTVYTYQEGSDEYVPSLGFSQQGQQRVLRESFWKFDETVLNATVHYNRLFDDVHSVSGFVGYEQAESTRRNFWAERRGFPTPDHSELFAGDDDGQQSYGESQSWSRVNYFAALSYDYDKKYYLDFTIRHDGSSNFGPNKRFGTFPGVAASWAIHEEGFMNNVSWLSTLKLRASWAKMGNDRTDDPNQWRTRYDYGSGTNVARPNFYVVGEGGVSNNGFRSAGVPNPDVTWETAYMQNIGLSFGMFSGRLTGDLNYFYQNRQDILVDETAAIPDAIGINNLPEKNIGIVDSFGYEIELAWNDRVGNVGYNLGLNFTNAQNRVVSWPEPVDIPDKLRREGHSIDSYIVYPTNGVFRDQAQVDAAPAKLNGTVEGEPYYIDTDENGTINADDRVRTFTSNVPQIQYGITGGLNYKNFDFHFLFQGQAKAEMLVFFDQNGAKPEHVFTQRWTPENRDSRYPRAFGQGDPYSGNQSGDSENFEGADFWLHDASFVRLKEIEVGYTFNKSQIRFADVKLFVRGLNLFTFFSDVYDLGLDPEAAGYNNFRGSTYPSLKTYTLGMNFTF